MTEQITDLRAAVHLASKALERDGKPVRAEIANELKQAFSDFLVHYHATKGSGWVNVADRLPESNTPVLVWYKNQQLPYDTHISVKKLRGFETHITHWQPLPQPEGGV